MLELSGIVSDSIVDGPGIRTTIFSQGCPHHCPGCHNPETWDFGCGTDVEEERLVEIVRSNPLCRGVTFSGGEPFAQAAGFAKLAKLLKAKGYEIGNSLLEEDKMDLAKEYGVDTIQIHADALSEDDVVLLHDDLLATGGSMAAALELVRKFNVKKVYINFIIELEFLNGRKAIGDDVEISILLSF